MRRDKKYYVANNVLGTVAAGLIAGRGARMMAGWIVGPGILDIAGMSKSGTGIIEGHHPKPGVAPENIPPREELCLENLRGQKENMFCLKS